MSRWGARIAGVILLLLFTIVFVQMYRQLKVLEQMQQREGRTPAGGR